MTEHIAVVWALAGPRREENIEVQSRPMHHIVKLCRSQEEADKILNEIEQRAHDQNIITHKVLYGISLSEPGKHTIDIYTAKVNVNGRIQVIFS